MQLSHSVGLLERSALRFKDFNVKNIQQYNKYYSKIEPISDLSPNNLVVWLNINNDLQIAVDNGNAILKYTCPFFDNSTVFTIVGINNPIKTVNKIFKYQSEHNLPQKIVMNSEATISKLHASNVKIFEDNDNFDYIYLVSDKADLFHASAGKFRRTINKFIRDYGDDVKIKELDLNDSKEVANLINSLHIWKSLNTVSNNDKLNIEGVAIDRYMNNRSYLCPKCIGVYIDDKLVGFSIYHFPPHKQYAIINHIKCNYEYINVFDFLFFCVMNNLKMHGIKYANGEQDLGIEGIRNYKHKLGPYRYIKRYTILPS